MTPDQISQAIATALSDGGEQLVEGTLAAVLPILWMLMVALPVVMLLFLQAFQAGLQPYLAPG